MNNTLKHTEFIRLVASGLTQTNAYRQAVAKNGASKKLCEQKGCRLAKRYALEIQQERERLQRVVQAAADSKVAKIESMRILSKAERMEYLSNIVRGEIKINEVFVINGVIKEHLVEPSISERRAAIAELNKMDGAYAPIETKSAFTINFSERRKEE
jgi:hypothetical protein